MVVKTKRVKKGPGGPSFENPPDFPPVVISEPDLGVRKVRKFDQCPHPTKERRVLC